MERRFRSSDWMIIGAAALLLVASVLPWWRLRFDEMFVRRPRRLRLPADGHAAGGRHGRHRGVDRDHQDRVARRCRRGWSTRTRSRSPSAVVAILIGDRFLVSGFEDADGDSRGLGLYLAVARRADRHRRVRDWRSATCAVAGASCPTRTCRTTARTLPTSTATRTIATTTSPAASTPRCRRARCRVVRPVEPAPRPRPETADREPSPRRRGHRPTEVDAGGAHPAAPARYPAGLIAPGYGRRRRRRPPGGRSGGREQVPDRGLAARRRPARRCSCSAWPCLGDRDVPRPGLDGARNAFDYPLTGGIAWVLVVGAGVLTFLRAGRLMSDGKVPWTRLVVIGTAVAVRPARGPLGLGAGDDARADWARRRHGHRPRRRRRRARRCRARTSAPRAARCGDLWSSRAATARTAAASAHRERGDGRGR